MTDSNNSNNSNSAPIVLDFAAPWRTGTLSMSKRLVVEKGKPAKTFEAGSIEYSYPVPFTGAALKEPEKGKESDVPEYVDGRVQFAYSALMTAVQAAAKACYSVDGDSKDTLSIVAKAGSEVPTDWETLTASTSRVRYFEELKKLSTWRSGLAGVLAALKKKQSVIDKAVDAFSNTSAAKIASHYLLADADKRKVLQGFVDQYHATLSDEEKADLAPAMAIVANAFELASNPAPAANADDEL